MDGSINRVWKLESLESSEEEHWRCQLKHNKSRHRPCDKIWQEYFKDRDNRNSKGSPAYPHFEYKVTKQSLCIDASHDPSSELSRRGLAQHRALCDNMKKTIHAKASQRNHRKASTFVALLRACAKKNDLVQGTRVHDDILKTGLLKHCLDALVIMYAKCGALAKAKELLDMHKSRNVVTWTALVSGYAQYGQGQQALNCFEQMQWEGLYPDGVTFLCTLKACGCIGAIEKGEQIHGEIARQGLLGNDIVLGTALVDMYAKCSALSKARQVLEELPSRNVITWNALIAGYAQAGQGEQALNCFERMQHDGLSPNAVTFACILKACGSIRESDKGEQIHDKIAKQGLLENNIILGTALVDMYAKCGALAKAQRVLEELPSRDVITWNALIAGYAEHDQGEQALNCFERMQDEGLSPDAVTFACVLKACGSIRAIRKGEQIHDEVSRQGLLANSIVLGTALVDMYAKCGSLTKAQRLLEELPSRDVITWNALITGYAEQGQGEQALNCLEQMEREGLSPNAVSFACILKACGSIGAIDKGEQIHDEISRQGLLGNNIVLSTALVDMYAKCGALAKAQLVLEQLSLRDVSTWNALITGYVQQGQGEQALNCYEQMQREGVSPNAVTFACILKACGSLGAADKGEQIHDEIARQGLLGNNILLGTALVDMYAKCGALGKARGVLEKLPSRDVTSWSALIAGYVKQGQGDQALHCFEGMQREGLSPNAVTFSCVLNACSHLGLVDDGHLYFLSMSTKYGVKQDFEHFACMVDLFGRAGHLDKAVRVIQEMPSSEYFAAWSALLGACHKWGDINVGRWAFEHAVQVDYVLMANICAAAGMKEDAENIEAIRLKNKAWR